MGSYWRSLRLADRIAIITLLVTVALGLLAVVPAYLAFFTDDDAPVGAGAPVRESPVTGGPTPASPTTTDESRRFRSTSEAPGPPGVGDTPGTHLGKWKGTGTQGQGTYPVYVTVTGGVAGAKIGEMFFPINKCKFNLVLVDVAGPVVTMQADLVNSGQCGGARATLTANPDGSLTYVVPHPGDPSVTDVSAPLYPYDGPIPGTY